MLYELLRCFKALSTSEIGCSALRSASPTPFAQLVCLLYSDKKPGDVASRQLIAELLLSLFDLYPSSSLPSPASITGTPRRREVWEDSWDTVTYPFSENPRLISFPPPHRNQFSFLRSLLLTKAPPPAEPPASNVSPHEFIESLHIPRIFKTYLQELSDVCRDYFWVFCHPSNTIWNLEPDMFFCEILVTGLTACHFAHITRNTNTSPNPWNKALPATVMPAVMAASARGPVCQHL